METNGNIKWDDDRIDDLARKAFSGQKFTYDPSFFAEVEKMLPKEKKRRGLGFWWFVLLPVVMLGAYFLLPLQSDDSKKGIAILAESENESNSSDRSNQNKGTESQNKTESKTTTNPTEELEKSALTEKSGGKIIPLIKKSLEPQSSSRSQSNNNIADKAIEKLNKLTEHPNMPLVTLEQVISNKRSTEKAEGNLSNQGQDMDAIIGVEGSPQTGPLTKLNLVNSIKQLEEKPLLSIPERKQYEVGRIPFRKMEGVSTFAQPTTDFSLLKLKSKKDHAIFVQAGLGLGTAVSEGRSMLTKSGLLGMGYNYQSGYWGFSLGLMAEVEKTFIEMKEQSQHYSYDLDTYQNIYQYTDLYRLDFPLMVQFKKDKHQLNFGPTLQLFVHSAMNYSYLKNGNSERTGLIMGENYGLRKVNLQMSLGYGFYVSRNIMIGGNLSYQLFDPIQNREIASTVVTPFSGQIYIRHLIRQKR